MSLPRLEYPIFQTELISIGPVKFRPFTVKEEKIFLIAQESKADVDIVNAIKQVASNCTDIRGQSINIDKIPVFDIEYLFLQLRCKSVGDLIEYKFRDLEDKKIYDHQIDVNSIKPVAGPNHSNRVILSNGMILDFRYPTLSDLNVNNKIEIIVTCLEKIFDADTTYDAASYSREEREEFVNTIGKPDYEKIIELFVDSMPKISYTVKYKNSNNKNKEFTLEGLNDFFPWG